MRISTIVKMVLIPLSLLVSLSNFITASQTTQSNFVSFQTGILTLTCDSRDVPMWSWLGKTMTDHKSMAVGVKKQNRFAEPRYETQKFHGKVRILFAQASMGCIVILSSCPQLQKKSQKVFFHKICSRV